MSVENFVDILGILFKTLMSADADKELADADEVPRMRLRIQALRMRRGCGSHFSYPRRPLPIDTRERARVCMCAHVMWGGEA